MIAPRCWSQSLPRAFLRCNALHTTAPRHLLPRIRTLPFSASAIRPVSSDSLPTIVQPAFWRSLMPKALRSDPSHKSAVFEESQKKSKDWNPATFFIIIFLLIGSQAIQTVSLQNSFDQFSNETETKLALLREVVGLVQKGEEVDVEDMLGTGNPVKEREWEDVIRELEQEDTRIRVSRSKRRKAAKTREDQSVGSADPSDANSPSKR